MSSACGRGPISVQAIRLWVWDDYTYHMVYPALWLRQHAIAAPIPPQAFTMQAWYPLSASVVATWFMAPLQGSRGDALAWVSLTGPLYGGIIAGGAATLLARMGCRPGAWAVPIVLFATSPRIDVMASSFSDADLALAAALFGGLVFAVPRAPDEAARDVAADAAYAGLLERHRPGDEGQRRPAGARHPEHGRAARLDAGRAGVEPGRPRSWSRRGGS